MRPSMQERVKDDMNTRQPLSAVRLRTEACALAAPPVACSSCCCKPPLALSPARPRKLFLRGRLKGERGGIAGRAPFSDQPLRGA
jgi:hypothetical protein